MSFTRLGQASAEIRSIDGVLSRAFYRASTSGTYAKTGNYSYETGQNEVIGIGFEQKQSIRTACHFLIPTFSWSGYWPLFLTARNSTVYAHGLRADAANETLDLFIDKSEVDSVPFAEAGINEGEWFHIALNFDGANSRIVVWGNESQIFDYSGSFSNTYVNGAWSGSLSAPALNTYCDNLYADEMTDEPYSKRPPKKHFFYAVPNAAGEFYDWTTVNETANWRAVDETPHNSDTDYNKALSASLVDTFGMTTVNIPENDDEITWIIRAVIPQGIVKRNDVSIDSDIAMLAYDGSNFSYGDAHQNVGPAYQLFWNRFEYQPDGSSWNETDVNSMEYGYISSGTFT